MHLLFPNRFIFHELLFCQKHIIRCLQVFQIIHSLLSEVILFFRTFRINLVIQIVVDQMFLHRCTLKFFEHGFICLLWTKMWLVILLLHHHLLHLFLLIELNLLGDLVIVFEIVLPPKQIIMSRNEVLFFLLPVKLFPLLMSDILDLKALILESLMG